MKSSEVLRHARALISIPEKWCQGTYETSDGRYCMLGAVMAITAKGPDFDWGSLTRALGCPPGQWNDQPGRTHAEVMAVFDRAIAAEEARESAA